MFEDGQKAVNGGEEPLDLEGWCVVTQQRVNPGPVASLTPGPPDPKPSTPCPPPTSCQVDTDLTGLLGTRRVDLLPPGLLWPAGGAEPPHG